MDVLNGSPTIRERLSRGEACQPWRLPQPLRRATKRRYAAADPVAVLAQCAPDDGMEPYRR